MPVAPSLLVLPARGAVRGLVLVAHGGSARSSRPARPLSPAVLRMWPFVLDTWLRGRRRGISVALLRYGANGWNDGAALDDARWGLAELRRRHPGVPVTLIGHSLGGRVVVRLAADDGVAGVCALAPWLPPGEPAEQLAGRTVLVLHGGRDHVTDPGGSYEHALRARAAGARICRFDIRGAGHAMLERVCVWQGMARRFALATLGAGQLEPAVSAALAAPAPHGCRVQI